MPTENPFDIILLKLDHLQSTVDDLYGKVSTKENTSKVTNLDRLIDLPEAAKLMKKPVGTIRYYIHHRNLPAKRIGKSFIIKYSDLMSWIDTFNEDGQELIRSGEKKMLQNRKRYNKQPTSFSSGTSTGK